MRKFLALSFLSILTFSSCLKSDAYEDSRYIIETLERGTWEITTFTLNGVNAMDSIDYHFPGRSYYFKEWWVDLDHWTTALQCYLVNSDSNPSGGLIFHDGNSVRGSLTSIPLYKKYGKDYDSLVTFNYDAYYGPIQYAGWEVKQLDNRNFHLMAGLNNQLIFTRK